ncbi:MAG: DNA methyltransferase [Candidatus Liptonbacteria bacterium]|nr:DNA methyltransferase [Candidatus Liptonbacteria bacterium]
MGKFNKNIIAETHPAHYMMHKYWGRKPHNVVRDYILNFTKPGDVVLDPFMGSGVVVIESLKNNRRAIGIDLNPMACFIAQNTINDIDMEDFQESFENIYNKNYKRFAELYYTKCPNCKVIIPFENSIWEADQFVKIKGTCLSCGKFIKDTDAHDRNVLGEARDTFSKLDKRNKIFYPKNEILKFVKRNGKTHLNQFFTERALVVLGSIIKDIEEIKNSNTKKLVLLCFTSMLPNVSKMIPGDKVSVNGRSGWVISKLWAPKIHTEKNPLNSFRERFNKIKKGKSELINIFNSKNAKILNIDATNLKVIENSSVNYIFTDPPYGDSIAYFGLSMFWNAWLKNHVDYDNEIIFDPYRNKKYEDYTSRMKKVYAELYRVLKNESYLSFTFHNRNLNIWKAVMDAVTDAGFHLINVVYQEQAVSSGTQGINRNNTLRGDFIYNFLKNKNTKTQKSITNSKIDSENEIVKRVNGLLVKANGSISSDVLYEKVIPFIVEKRLYTDKFGQMINIEGMLKKHFSYNFVKTKNEYGWQKK